MTIDDAFAELGLSPDANLAQAKAAWRALVSRWHPDLRLPTPSTDGSR